MRVTKPTLVGGLVVLSMLALASAWFRSDVTGGAPRAALAGALGPREAAALAVQYAQLPTPAGRLVSKPTAVYAKQMSLGEAYSLKDGRLLDPDTSRGRERDRAVWLVLLHGDFAVNIDPMPGSGQRPRSETYHQMALILDAGTGEQFGSTFFRPGREPALAAQLPAVAQPLPDVALPRLATTPVAPQPLQRRPGQPEPLDGPPTQSRPSQASPTPAR